MKTIKDQVTDLENTVTIKRKRMHEIMSKAGEEGRTTDAAESEEFDTLGVEVKSLTQDLERLKTVDAMNVETAKPVVDESKAGAAVASQSFITTKSNEPAGLAFAKWATVCIRSKGITSVAESIAESMFKDDPRIARIAKAAARAGSTQAGNWAAELVSADGAVFAEFLAFLRPQTILGRFGAGGIPALRRLPFDTPVLTQTQPGNAYWVGEAAAKPLTSFGATRTLMKPLKVANIAVLTQEVVMRAELDAQMWVRDQLVAALKQRLDIDFIDPAKSAVADISPASITNGVTAIVSSGATADNVRADVRSAMATFIAANNAPSTGVWIMSATRALALSLMTNALGQPEFGGVSMRGGTFAGLPVVVSEFVAPGVVVLVNASDIFFNDEGGVQIASSTEASLEMETAPVANSATPTPGIGYVSMFQTNSIAVRVEQFVNWSKARPSAVALITGAAWG